MSYLTINGWAIPTIDGATSVEPKRVGTRSRSVNGTHMTNEVAQKSEVKSKTAPVREITSEAIQGAINGDGHVWQFLDNYSSRGLAGAGDSARLFGRAADGDPVVDSTAPPGTITVPNELQGHTAIQPRTTITNMLAANQRDCEGDTTGFTVIATGTLGNSTAHKVQGSQSVSVLTAASGDGVTVDSVSISSSTQYSASVYIKTTLQGTVRIKILGDLGAARVNTTFETYPQQWALYNVTYTSDAVDATADLQVIWEESAANTIYIDALQFQTGATSTGWVDGAVAHSLTVNTNALQGAGDWSINAWVKATATPSGYRYIFSIQGLGDGYAWQELWRAPSGYLSWQSQTKEVAFSTLTGSTDPWTDADWHMITVVSRVNPDADESYKEIFVDGVSYDTDATNAAGPGDRFSGEQMAVGDSGAGSELWDDGDIAEFTILPYAMTAGQALGLYNSGLALPDLPKINVDGDAVPKAGTYRGMVDSVDSVGAFDSGTWYDHKRVGFKLEEF